MANPNFQDIYKPVAIGLAVAGGTAAALLGKEATIVHAQETTPQFDCTKTITLDRPFKDLYGFTFHATAKRDVECTLGSDGEVDVIRSMQPDLDAIVAKDDLGELIIPPVVTLMIGVFLGTIIRPKQLRTKST